MKTIRYFNTEGCCLPAEHYMVPLDDRIKTIRELYIDRKKYFVINRGRQYGKTTMLVALAAALRTDFAVILMDFQLMSTTSFVEEPALSHRLSAVWQIWLRRTTIWQTQSQTKHTRK